MKKSLQISEAEYEVMKIVWKKAPINTNEITAILTRTTDWSPKTIQTLIKRLVQKGALTYEKDSRVFVYTPLVKKEEYLEHQNSSFLNRYYGGSIATMLNSYLNSDLLTNDDIAELRNILNHASRQKED